MSYIVKVMLQYHADRGPTGMAQEGSWKGVGGAFSPQTPRRDGDRQANSNQRDVKTRGQEFPVCVWGERGRVFGEAGEGNWPGKRALKRASDERRRRERLKKVPHRMGGWQKCPVAFICAQKEARPT